MKTLLIMMSLLMANAALATQVETDCIAMNESREKIDKAKEIKQKKEKPSSSKQ